MIGVVSHAGDPHAIAVLNHLRSTGADVVHDVAFAFAFHAFHPDGTWMLE